MSQEAPDFVHLDQASEPEPEVPTTVQEPTPESAPPEAPQEAKDDYI